MRRGAALGWSEGEDPRVASGEGCRRRGTKQPHGEQRERIHPATRHPATRHLATRRPVLRRLTGGSASIRATCLTGRGGPAVRDTQAIPLLQQPQREKARPAEWQAQVCGPLGNATQEVVERNLIVQA